MMKKIFAALATVMICGLLLVSCSGGEIKVPEGMQIVKENKVDGYVFFGPEAWVIANHGDVCSTYLSATSRVSITFTKITLRENETIANYFNTTSDTFPYPVSFYKDGAPVAEGEIPAGVKINFGTAEAGASDAYKYLYSYKYGETDVSCLQVILRQGDDHYLFTYTAKGLPTDENSSYKMYLDRAQLAIDNFIFTERSEGSQGTEYEKDQDGYILVSDKKVSGYALYVPDDYKVVNNTGTVEVKISNGANITMALASETQVGVLDYLLNRREKLVSITEEFNDIAITVAKQVNTESEYFKNWELSVLPQYDPTLKFGEIIPSNIAAYEYTYVYHGNTYHVYQVLGADMLKGYVFTYTALENEYNEHIDEIKTILGKVSFK